MLVDDPSYKRPIPPEEKVEESYVKITALDLEGAASDSESSSGASSRPSSPRTVAVRKSGGSEAYLYELPEAPLSQSLERAAEYWRKLQEAADPVLAPVQKSAAEREAEELMAERNRLVELALERKLKRERELPPPVLHGQSAILSPAQVSCVVCTSVCCVRVESLPFPWSMSA